MIIDTIGNLLDTKRCENIVHQANLFHTFGAGIAKAIKDKFPEAYDADLRTRKGDKNKLGTYSVGDITDSKGTAIKRVYNLYSQIGLGSADRQTSYDALEWGLTALRDELSAELSPILGIPYQLGCGLANGDWRVVSSIIESVFEGTIWPVYIYKLPEIAEKEKQMKKALTALKD